MLTHIEAWEAFGTGQPLSLQKTILIREVRAVLGHNPGATLSTTDLVGAIYPPEFHRGEAGKVVVKRIYSLLSSMATTDLAAFNIVGAPVVRKRFGVDRTEKPRLWRFAHTDECADMRAEAEAEEAGQSKPATLYALILQAKDFADFQRLVREVA